MTVRRWAKKGMLKRQQNDPPSSPCTRSTGGPDPARRYRSCSPFISTVCFCIGMISRHSRFVDNHFPDSGIQIDCYRLCRFYFAGLFQEVPQFFKVKPLFDRLFYSEKLKIQKTTQKYQFA